MSDTVTILFLGDVIGKPGRVVVKELLPKVVGDYSPDVVIANGENLAGGFGITEAIYEEMLALNIDVITTGNHVWDRKEALELFGGGPADIVRPANYPEGTPGSGWTLFTCASGAVVGVLNLSGRVFMDALDCPFRTAQAAVKEIRKSTPVIFVDMHAETTSEKNALGWYLDGSVSAVVGTHTHVQTSDERVLPGGTAYLTDAGMTGPTESVIGMQREIVINRFLTSRPNRFEVASKGLELQGAVITVSASDGRAKSIERIKLAI